MNLGDMDSGDMSVRPKTRSTTKRNELEDCAENGSDFDDYCRENTSQAHESYQPEQETVGASPSRFQLPNVGRFQPEGLQMVGVLNGVMEANATMMEKLSARYSDQMRDNAARMDEMMRHVADTNAKLMEASAAKMNDLSRQFTFAATEALQKLGPSLDTPNRRATSSTGPVRERPGQHPGPCPADDSASESEAEASASRSTSVSRSSNRRPSHAPRLPPFTGNEKWEVWINRFKDVAKIFGWTDNKQLGELLPRLQGPAGEFVYDQLQPEIRSNLRSLMTELDNRFRVVETRKTYKIQFANRTQKTNETVEQYAGDLKRLYDKAHGNRAKDIRDEDLVRKFLEGLSDEKARFHVEFVKSPTTVDQAVGDVVNFSETSRKPNRNPTRAVRREDSESDNESDQCERAGKVARLPGRPAKNRNILQDAPVPSSVNTPPPQATPSSLPPAGTEAALMETTMERFNQMLQTMEKRLGDSVDPRKQARDDPRKGRPGNQWNRANNYNEQNNQNRREFKPRINAPYGRNGPNYSPDFACYACGQDGHFARDCPTRPWGTGHMQMAVQPTAPVYGSSVQVDNQPPTPVVPNQTQNVFRAPPANSATIHVPTASQTNQTNFSGPSQ